MLRKQKNKMKKLKSKIESSNSDYNYFTSLYVSEMLKKKYMQRENLSYWVYGLPEIVEIEPMNFKFQVCLGVDLKDVKNKSYPIISRLLNLLERVDSQ